MTRQCVNRARGCFQYSLQIGALFWRGQANRAATALAAAALLLAFAAGAATPESDWNAFESAEVVKAESQIDKLVLARLSKLNIHPALCSDAVFVRRVYLDVIGTLPTAKEAADFLRNTDGRNKRRVLIDRLLER